MSLPELCAGRHARRGRTAGAEPACPGACLLGQQGETDGERAALAEDGLDADRAVVAADDGVGDREAEPRALDGAGGRVGATEEAVEQVGLVLEADADA